MPEQRYLEGEMYTSVQRGAHGAALLHLVLCEEEVEEILGASGRTPVVWFGFY